LLAPLHSGRNVPEFPNLGKLRASFFQPLENRVAMTSNDWK
jgi:hypothetical protein